MHVGSEEQGSEHHDRPPDPRPSTLREREPHRRNDGDAEGHVRGEALRCCLPDEWDTGDDRGRQRDRFVTLDVEHGAEGQEGGDADEAENEDERLRPAPGPARPRQHHDERDPKIRAVLHDVRREVGGDPGDGSPSDQRAEARNDEGQQVDRCVRRRPQLVSGSGAKCCDQER